MAVWTGTLTMQKLHPSFGVEITGGDLRQPLDDRYLGAHLGSLPRPLVPGLPWPAAHRRRADARDRLHPNLVELANVDEEGRLMDWSDRRMLYQSGNQLSHSDSSFLHRTTVAGDGPMA
jgi:hypothetical protein